MKKTIALVAHDNRKEDLIEWVEWNHEILIKNRLICTGTTGKLVEKAINKKLDLKENGGLDIVKLKSGPLGGDQQLGAMICENEVDMIIFLWDPMEPQPHDVDVKALLRISVLYNVPIANNRATADYLISSPLFSGKEYTPVIKDYTGYINRKV